MKTDGYVDRSLDDFIKANRGMFRRGRGGGGSGRGAASTRGRRGRGQSRGSARGRSGSRGAARGSSRGAARGSSRGGRGGSRGVTRGRSATPRGRGRGRAAARSSARGQRGTPRSGRGASSSFGQRWRAASDRMGSHLESVTPATTPVKRKQFLQMSEIHQLRQSKRLPAPILRIHRNLIGTTIGALQLAVRAVRSSKLAGRLGGTPIKGAKRITALALKKKRQALQQLTTDKQLSRVDARNQILMKRRGLPSPTSGPSRRGRGASRGAAAGFRPPRQGRIQVLHQAAPAPVTTRAPLRRPLNRSRITGSAVTAPAGSSLLTVQFKNDIAVRQRRAPPPMELDSDEDMPLPPSPPPPPPPPPPPRNRAGLDPRIQQEIAAIQARGRAQHHQPDGGRSSGVSNFRPTAATSSRTLNDRFTADRMIFS